MELNNLQGYSQNATASTQTGTQTIDPIQEALQALEGGQKGQEKQETEKQERYKATLARLAEREREREERRSRERESRSKELEELKRYKSLFGENVDEIKNSPKKLLKQLGHDDPYKAFLEDETELEKPEEEKPLTRDDIMKLAEEMAAKKFNEIKEKENYEASERQAKESISKQLEELSDKFPLASKQVTTDELLEVMWQKYENDVAEHGEDYANENKLSVEAALDAYQKHLESELEKMLESKHIKRLLASKMGAKLPDDVDDVVNEYVTSNDDEASKQYNAKLTTMKQSFDAQYDKDKEILEALAALEEKKSY